MRKGSSHQHFESDAIALAKLLMKEREKPGKFFLPHGMSSCVGVFAFSWRIIPQAFRIKTLWISWNYQSSKRVWLIPDAVTVQSPQPRPSCNLSHQTALKQLCHQSLVLSILEM
jgi:hypothetical protein